MAMLKLNSLLIWCEVFVSKKIKTETLYHICACIPTPTTQKEREKKKNSKAVDGKRKTRISSVLSKTFCRNAINDDGGIPGFEAFAAEQIMCSDFSESWACSRASNVSFVADEAYKNHQGWSWIQRNNVTCMYNMYNMRESRQRNPCSLVAKLHCILKAPECEKSLFPHISKGAIK